LAYALRGETERAVIELVEARRLILDGRYSSIAVAATTRRALQSLVSADDERRAAHHGGQ